MRYAREELESYDGYGYEDEEQEFEDDEDEYGEEEEEQEEETVHQPTKEEMEYLRLRQLLKESIRKKMKKENSTARKDSNQSNKLPFDNNYGSFFGPSQPIISQRVIQEGKSLVENRHLMSKAVSKPLNSGKDNIYCKKATPSAHKVFTKVRHEESKVEKIKNNRDYSFLLSDDAELPAAPKKTLAKNVSVPRFDARPTQVHGKHKQAVANGSTGKQSRNGHDSRRPVHSSSGQVHPKTGSSNKIASSSKQNILSIDSRKKQLGSNNGVGPGRPMVAKPLPSKAPPTMENRASTHVTKYSTNSTKTSVHGMKNPTDGLPRPTSKLQSPVPKQQMDQRRDSRLPVSRPKMVPKQSVPPPRPQMSKPLRPHPSAQPPPSQQPKKKPKMDPAILEIRKMFGYDPSRYADGEDDDRAMEANFEDIEREERRSAKIAAMEDEEEFRKIQEEEKRERMKKLKKRKHGA